MVCEDGVLQDTLIVPAGRKLAFDHEVPISAAIAFVIEEALRKDKETPPPAESWEAPPQPEESPPKEWSAVSRSFK